MRKQDLPLKETEVDFNHASFRAIIVMGVAGCGKTTIASRLAERLGWLFIESDDYHSAEQVSKMASGIPLTDADRQPWLESLHTRLVACSLEGKSVVMACSALKENYRQILCDSLDNVQFVYLKGNYRTILHRMQKREHFMKPELLKSQFDALEEPSDSLTINIGTIPDQIVAEILSKI